MVMPRCTVAGPLAASCLLLLTVQAASAAAASEAAGSAGWAANGSSRNSSSEVTTSGKAGSETGSTTRLRSTTSLPSTTTEEEEKCEFEDPPEVPFAWEPLCGTKGHDGLGCHADGKHRQCMFCGKAPYGPCPTCEFRVVPNIRAEHPEASAAPWFWDSTCLTGASLGCKADGKHKECRFCGFGVYSRVKCPSAEGEEEEPEDTTQGPSSGSASTSKRAGRNPAFDVKPGGDNETTTAASTSAAAATTSSSADVYPVLSSGQRALPAKAAAVLALSLAAVAAAAH